MRINSTDAVALNTGSIAGSNFRPVDTGITAVEGVRKTRPAARNSSSMTELEKRELPVSEKAVIDAVERANKVVSIANRRFEYSIHEETKQIMVKVIDVETEEIVREIPPEKILDLVATIWEMVGLIVDERR